MVANGGLQGPKGVGKARIGSTVASDSTTVASPGGGSYGVSADGADRRLEPLIYMKAASAGLLLCTLGAGLAYFTMRSRFGRPAARRRSVPKGSAGERRQKQRTSPSATSSASSRSRGHHHYPRGDGAWDHAGELRDTHQCVHTSSSTGGTSSRERSSSMRVCGGRDAVDGERLHNV